MVKHRNNKEKTYSLTTEFVLPLLKDTANYDYSIVIESINLK